MIESKKFFTRPEAAEFLTSQGLPISAHTLANYNSRREGPPVASFWGRRPLYRPADLRAWAEARLRPVEAA